MQYFKGDEIKNVGLIPDLGAEQYEDKVALIFQGEKLTFQDLSRRTNKLASGLEKIGMSRNDKVALYMPNSVQFIEAFFATIKTGATPVPLNLRMPPKNLDYVVNDSGSDMLIGPDIETKNCTKNKALNLLESSNINKLILPGKEGDKIYDYNKLKYEGAPAFGYANQSLDDVAEQLYTSGTTGKPKGVPLTHRNVLSTVEGFGKVMVNDSSDRMVLVLPLFHAYGLNALMCNLLHYGCSIVLQAEPDPGAILNNIEKYNCTTFAGVPALFRMMWLIYSQEPEDYNLSSLKDVACAASPLDENTRKKVKEGWQVTFGEGWGMTETSPCGTLNTGRIPKEAGCIGWPVRNIKFKLVDPDTGETVVPWDSIAPWGVMDEEYVGVSGECAVKGPAVFEGYHNMPEKNDKVFDDEGWFLTGDLMEVDEDGALWMVERTDDMILSGGENIYPSEVEDALHEHNEINDVAVVPAPHKTKGEVPVAFVVLAESSNLTEDDIKEFALERVPTYAHPRKVFFVDNIPKSGTLKTQHFKLEERVEEELEEPLGEL